MRLSRVTKNCELSLVVRKQVLKSSHYEYANYLSATLLQIINPPPGDVSVW